MTNKRRKAREDKLEKNNDRLVSYHAARNGAESVIYGRARKSIPKGLTFEAE